MIPVYNKDVYIDATVQEKNITFPTDDKLERKIIKRCRKIADRNGLELHRSYRQILKNLSYGQRFRKRAGIELIIAHLKEDHRLSRNYYKGIVGDEINVMLAAAGFNFKRMMNKWKSSFWLFLEKIIVFLNRQLHPIRGGEILQTREKWAF